VDDEEQGVGDLGDGQAQPLALISSLHPAFTVAPLPGADTSATGANQLAMPRPSVIAFHAAPMGAPMSTCISSVRLSLARRTQADLDVGGKRGQALARLLADGLRLAHLLRHARGAGL